MIKAIKKLRNRAIILAILEILLLLFVNLAYAINIFNIGDFFTPLIVFIFSGSLVLVNVIEIGRAHV